MEKIFISAGQLLADSFLLAERVYASGYRPDLIVGVWRGGTPVAIAVQEYLDVRGCGARHVPVKTCAYRGIDERRGEVEVTGLDLVADAVDADSRLLIVDDVFDTGVSLEALLGRLRFRLDERCPREIRIACPWFKPGRNTTALRPDYYLHETDTWLVFPHELAGLTAQEIARKPDLTPFLDRLHLESSNKPQATSDK
ncbi:MAG: hypoxanthine phosphoribosyltransferase [Gammaproteobacteria bacterium]|nr:hypoxanthine phosphoribosyltransferase [Gammaproteobacteria bacterium]